jgi:hypothetical protein
LTLVVVPVLYYILSDAVGVFLKKLGWKPEAEEAVENV